MRSAGLLLLAGLAASEQPPVTCPDGATLCPVGNTCCRSGDGYGCLSNEFEGAGACCDPHTGCAHGYSCVQDGCTADNATKHPLALRTPRYHLCNAPLRRTWALSVGTGPKLEYYSSVGDLRQTSTAVTAAVIIVHGAGRNADDYFCVGVKIAAMQTVVPRGEVAVFAPHFVVPQDGPPEGIMSWNGTDGNGIWRYGATALPPATVGSYDAMDALLSAITDAFPRLRTVSIAGHSSGGQFAQRYALSSTSPIFSSSTVRVRVVVANPSSFAYLDSRRWVKGELVEPDATGCPGYDSWEWGLHSGEPSPYFEDALTSLGTDGLSTRYAARDVFYLIGGSDVCNVTRGWCQSHGLETTCADMLQGRTRRERAEQYHAFLRRHYGRDVHGKGVVPGVGHDHALMFESSVGLSAVFG
eukprot:TRINITY_DN32617_c0_g1_i1.p1 TRINITY_DN32617_c0_g1~~TRINITY_DN32617_c0_g1_i1.p1  ORF type:complete len:431 (+),score=101.18 TRINITY_DN32617_c0_g1_i1:56-1294(+)